jgi:hypothetical protein
MPNDCSHTKSSNSILCHGVMVSYDTVLFPYVSDVFLREAGLCALFLPPRPRDRSLRALLPPTSAWSCWKVNPAGATDAACVHAEGEGEALPDPDVIGDGGGPATAVAHGRVLTKLPSNAETVWELAMVGKEGFAETVVGEMNFDNTAGVVVE